MGLYQINIYTQYLGTASVWATTKPLSLAARSMHFSIGSPLRNAVIHAAAKLSPAPTVDTTLSPTVACLYSLPPRARGHASLRSRMALETYFSFGKEK